MASLISVAQVDPFDGAIWYEKWFDFHPTLPVNPNFVFYGIENSNFLMNTGSFFIFQVSFVIVLLLSFIINMAARRHSDNKVFRIIGSFVFYKSYLGTLKNYSIRFYVESYFDLVMSVLMNFHSMLDYNAIEFFITGHDIFNQTLSALFGFFSIYFIIFYWYKIKKQYK